MRRFDVPPKVVEIQGYDELVRSLKATRQQVARASERAAKRIGLVAVREAKANAPRSPTMAQHSATLKRKRRTKARNHFAGSLEKSIEFETDGGKAIIFVASNSLAGKYAARIHDEKGKTWWKRGAGTIAKGARADEKFIERAVVDGADNWRKIYEDELKKEIAHG